MSQALGASLSSGLMETLQGPELDHWSREQLHLDSLGLTGTQSEDMGKIRKCRNVLKNASGNSELLAVGNNSCSNFGKAMPLTLHLFRAPVASVAGLVRR